MTTFHFYDTMTVFKRNGGLFYLKYNFIKRSKAMGKGKPKIFKESKLMSNIEVKEMVYQVKRLETPEILASGNVCGYQYYVVSMGMWPCAYVSIPKEDICFGQTDLPIDCHGGITYNRTYLLDSAVKDGWVIGWDYGHCFDYNGYNMTFGDPSFPLQQKKYSTEEMINDCKDVIKQLVELNKNNGE